MFTGPSQGVFFNRSLVNISQCRLQSSQIENTFCERLRDEFTDCFEAMVKNRVA